MTWFMSCSRCSVISQIALHCLLALTVLNNQFLADATNPKSNALRAEMANELCAPSLLLISRLHIMDLSAEIFPTEIRALGASLRALTNWVSTYHNVSPSPSIRSLAVI